MSTSQIPFPPASPWRSIGSVLGRADIDRDLRSPVSATRDAKPTLQARRAGSHNPEVVVVEDPEVLPISRAEAEGKLSTSGTLNEIEANLLDHLSKEGLVSDIGRMRTRLRLGFPSWLALEMFGSRRTEEVLSQVSGLPLLDEVLESVVCDHSTLRAQGLRTLKARRWAPLVDGRVAIADPLGPLPEGALESRPLCIAPAWEIDKSLRAASLEGVEESATNNSRRLGRILLERQISEKDLALALDKQERSGGRIGEILLAHGAVDASTLTSALAEKLDLPALRAGEGPEPLFPARLARTWRAVALSEGPEKATEEPSPIPVAFADPTAETVRAAQEYLEQPIQPKLTDEETFNRLSGEAYMDEDVEEVTTSLLKQKSHLSAYGNKLSLAQLLTVGALIIALIVGFAIDKLFLAVAAIGLANMLYVSYIIFRFYASWVGWRNESTIRPSLEDLQGLNERELPVYTVLLPMYGEKPLTVAALFESLSRLDYPKHKLDGLLLVEADDHKTQEAIEIVGKPGWLRVVDVPPEVDESLPEVEYFDKYLQKSGKPGWLRTLLIPSGGPRTKPKAMIYGLLYARGELLTVYDAEDQPDPYQLKKAVWAFQELEDESVACLQAKLNYYNPHQNLLTRWFTLEYSAWFDVFLPGLHQMGAPIPLGGTSNHFRVSTLKDALSWDPYNVTEDADLGLRLARMGKKTMMLESTTYEEANSRLKNWIRQRSRWIKGYMQTFLVHTRHPVALYREIGFKSFAVFLATIGGMIFTVLVSPIFWAILIMWILAQPGWIPLLFPGPVYFTALVSFFLGNFFFIFLSLVGATGRGYDDLTPHALLVPFYWVLLSVAGYLALYELIVRPYHWQKTEHGLHLKEEEAETSSPAAAETTLERTRK